MIDLTLSDSEHEGQGPAPPQQVQPQPAAQTPPAAAAFNTQDIDSDDDRPLHQIKAELLLQSQQRSCQQTLSQGDSKRAAGPQQASQGCCSNHQHDRSHERPSPAAPAHPKVVQEQPYMASTASQPSPAPFAAAAAAAHRAPVSGRATPSAADTPTDAPAAAAAATAGGGSGSGSGSGSGGRVSSGAHKRVQRRRSVSLKPLNFDDLAFDAPVDYDTGAAAAAAPAPSPYELEPLPKRLKTEPEGRAQQQQQPARPAAPRAGVRAATVGGVDSSDDEVVLCGELSPAAARGARGAAAAAAAGDGRKQQQQQQAPGGSSRARSGTAAAVAAAAAAGSVSDDDLWGMDAGLAADDFMWQPPAAAAAAAAGGSTGGGGSSECWDVSDDSDGGSNRRRGRQQPTGQRQARSSKTGSRGAAAAAAGGDGGGGDGAEGGGGRSGGGRARVRMTAEERAAERARKAAEKAAEKTRKQAEKTAAKLAKAAEAQAAKDAKRLDAFINRKINGRFGEYECVVVMDEVTSESALGLAIATELERRKTMGWQVVPQLPLSGRWSGCSCFCFKRRKLCEADEHDIKTATSARVSLCREDVRGRPPYLQLVFEAPGTFLQLLAADRLAGLMSAVAAAHPHCSLGVVVLGLQAHIRRVETQSLRQGGCGGGADWRTVSQTLLGLHLTTPGLQLRLLAKQEEAAAHIIHTARALGQQPYTAESQLEACGGGGPGTASKAAAGAMASALGPTTTSFAVSTLGKMHGMGGNKAWAIAEAYPSLGSLISAFERAQHIPGSQPSQLLADLTEPLASGKAAPRRVGPAMSARLHRLLTCENPDVVVEAAGEGAD